MPRCIVSSYYPPARLYDVSNCRQPPLPIARSWLHFTSLDKSAPLLSPPAPVAPGNWVATAAFPPRFPLLVLLFIYIRPPQSKKQLILGIMPAEPKHAELRQKMQALKNLYISRHYTQCAKFGERLLADVDSTVSETFIFLPYLAAATPRRGLIKHQLTADRPIPCTVHTSISTLRCPTTFWPGKPRSRTATASSLLPKSITVLPLPCSRRK